VLLASRFPAIASVVTIAANLDTDACAAYWGRQDLSGSLNPASCLPLSRQIQQRHYAGGKDRVVPPSLTVQAAAYLGATLIVGKLMHPNGRELRDYRAKRGAEREHGGGAEAALHN
jgi:hypothetical protein